MEVDADNAPSLTVLGAGRTVTGSRFLVEVDGTRLLVDCGLYQGRRELRRSNWERFPVDPATIDAVVLTHAHVDHCGYLPLLVRDGFAGPVYATRATCELVGIVLPDSGRLQEEEAAYANRKGYSKHRPALPLYTEVAAERALTRLYTAEFGETFGVGTLRVQLRPAGHILGSAIATVDGPGIEPVVFSGDLGRDNHPLLRAPTPPGRAGTIVVESTYGDREHDESAALSRLQRALVETLGRGGVVVVPAFAVDRTEVLLRALALMMRDGSVPTVPVFVDSPVALRALAVYRRHLVVGSADLRDEIVGTDEPVEPPRLREMHTPEESKSLHGLREPAVIISASGMATGGRVVHHLRHRLPIARDAVVLAGYQADGTRGRRLLDGEQSVKMLGEWVPVRAQIVDCTGLSVHADRNELLAWLRAAPTVGQVVVVHGEESTAVGFASAASDALGVPAVAPQVGDRIALG